MLTDSRGSPSDPRGAAVSNIYGKGPKGKATKLHAELVRSRGRCERCGSTWQLQCAHIISRRYSATRTDERNAWCLCATCHLFLGGHEFEHVEFALATIGAEVYAELRAKAYDNPRPWKQSMWEAEVVRLTALLAEVNA